MAVREATLPHPNGEWSAVQQTDGAPPDRVAGLTDSLRRWKWPLAAVLASLAVCGCASLTFPRGPTRRQRKEAQPPEAVVHGVPEVPTRSPVTPAPAPVAVLPDLGNETCLEVAGCPDEYPMPYRWGEWPEQYSYTGDFPEGFIWGVGTAAYQVEGAYREGGRGASIWDTFTGADTVGMPGANCSYCCKQAPCPVNPAMAVKGATGNVACDHYHMVSTDVTLMKSMGLRHYRFSIAWPRIFPTGRAKDGVNQEGVRFYNRLIDDLLAAGIKPYVTLYHWDLPQGLFDPPLRQAWWARDNVTGEPIQEIQDEYIAFVDFCFSTFGDRVQTWFTFNEPWTFTFLASGWGKAPCHPNLANWSIDPYVAGHNVLLAHAAAVDLYRRKYQSRQGGKIGITLNSDWREPHSDDPKDVAAAGRYMVFNLGWFADPIFGGKGDYPPAMRKFYGRRLANFTEAQSRLLNQSADFFALNHYGTQYAYYEDSNKSHDSSLSATSTEGLVHGQSVWLYGAGWGLQKLLNWVHRRYAHPPIYLTEGGWSIAADTAEEGVEDTMRVLYYANYTSAILSAISDDGVDVRGYFAWSLMDNFEWERGYVERFGAVFNDYAVGLDPQAPTRQFAQPTAGTQVRARKGSSCWLEQVWTDNKLVDPLSEAFQGCATPATFAGNYTTSRHPHCIRTITVDPRGKAGHIVGADNTKPSGCDGLTDQVWGPLAAFFSSTTVVADFSQIGGPSHISGFWNRTTLAIDWSDGSSWTSLRAPHEVPYVLTRAKHAPVVA